MHTAQLFDGTLLAEVLAYTGEMTEVQQPQSNLFSEKELGPMTQLEKTIHALYHAKFKAHGTIMQDVMVTYGLDSNTDPEVILQKATKEQFASNQRLLSEAKCLRRWLWDLLRLRFPEYRDISLAIRPGYTVVAGMSVNDMIEAYGVDAVFVIIKAK